MNTGSALEALLSGLRGHPSASTDWSSVIALANHSLLTPALFSSLAQAGQIERLPHDVAEFLRFIHALNQERNLRLREQLAEAVAALNGAGIVPLLLKGAVLLFVSPADRVPSRITSDLDLSVDQPDLPTARACLEALGYMQQDDARDMMRPQDVGILELRADRPGSLEGSKLVERDGLMVKVPSAESRALHWILHDLLKEGDYWRGRLGLRHLHDLSQLAQGEGVDWRLLRAALSDPRSRNALDTQLLALNDFFGTAVPAECIERPITRFQHWRRVFTAKHSTVGAPLRFAGNLAWGIWKITRIRDLARRDPVDLMRRIVRTLLDQDLRSKI